MTCIHFGLNCDTASLPDPLHGETLLGPQGMLSILETQLGLYSKDSALTDRLVQYLNCLKEADTPARFYTASFAADAFATASTLLQWRDQLYMAGWQGLFAGEVTPRLKDLADVERLASSQVEANAGQRLQRVIDTLSQQRSQITRIQLIDPLEHYPPLWQQLMCLLRDEHPVALSTPKAPAPSAPAETDLGKLQRALLNDSATPKLALSDDGSISRLTASSPELSAFGLAQLCVQYVNSAGQLPESVIVAEQNGSTLDASFEQYGLPRPGFSNQSPWRPSFQLLPLAFEILWLPLDPNALLQFLTHPVGPMPRRLKSRLADVVSKHPGIGGTQWHTEINDYIEELRTTNTESADKLLETIQSWLHTPRYAPDPGMPVSDAINHATLVADWLLWKNSQTEDNDRKLYALAHRQAMDLLNALRELSNGSHSTITREALRMLFKRVRGSGMGLVDKGPETTGSGNPVHASENPATVLSTRDLVIWWGLDMPTIGSRAPWLPSERRVLESNGVVLWSQDNQLSQQASTWIRPILAAKQQLVMIHHETTAQHHPIMDLIMAKVLQLPQQSLNDILVRGEGTRLNDLELSCAGEVLPSTPLPGKERWWQLNGADLPRRENESYSSLDKFINSPYQWVLDYHAKLRVGPLAQVYDEFRLKGLLTHSLYDGFFTQYPDIAAIDIQEIASWGHKYLDPLLAEEGATLLQPGHRSERERFIDQTIFALQELTRQLQASNVVAVKMEDQQTGTFIGGNLNSSIDILAINNDGLEAVIDIKWAGYKGRKNKWIAQDYLQLATYAHLRRQANGSYPALAYFFIQDRKLLSNDGDFFPNSEVINNQDKLTLANYWHDIETTWKWRRQQLDNGLIEVTVQGTEATEKSNPDDGLTIPEHSDTYNEFSTLTGWEQQA
jgi:PD-(D/E)XK nuclease superfamily